MLQIDKKFYIDTDQYNFMLREKTRSKAKMDGKKYKGGEDYESIVTHGYYSNIADALNEYLNIMIKRKVENSSTEVRELLDYIGEIKEEILQLTSLNIKK